MISLKPCLFLLQLLLLMIGIVSPNSQWILGKKELHPEAYLVKSFDSKVEGGDYVTYQLTSPGALDLVLMSRDGDADIFLGTKTKPTADDYEMSSATCATDSVHISKDMPRPVHISIFGSPYHGSTSFTLDAYLVPPKITYEDIRQSTESPSYEDLVYEHVQLREEHLTEGSRRGGGGSGSKSSSTSQRQGRKDTRGGGRNIGEDQSWTDWFLDAEEGHVAIFTVITGILKVVLQILG